MKELIIEKGNSAYLGFNLHAITQMDGELANISKRMLICYGMVNTENIRGGVFHQVDRG